MPQLQKAEDGQFVRRVCPSLRQRRQWPMVFIYYPRPLTTLSPQPQTVMLTIRACVLTEMRRNKASVSAMRESQPPG